MDNLNRILMWLKTTPYEGVVLGRRDNFKWITQFNENAVVTNAEVGIAFLVIQRNGKVEMVADSSDCPRMEKEQNALHADCVLVPWYETLEGFLAWYCNGKGYASDTMIPGTSCVQEELVNLRMRLNETEVARVEMVADSSDCPRMEKEQNALHADCVLVPWYETLEGFLAWYCNGKGYASDTMIPGTSCVQEELVNLRMRLNETEVARYHEIGQECANIVEKVAMEARPGQTEREVAALLKMRCIDKGISPDCVLVGSDERILNYRHPVPSDKKIKNSLMVVLGGEKYGLNISMTRMVYFQEIPKEIHERMQKTQYIFAAMQNMMGEGLPYKEYFEEVKSLYAQAGYPDEWKMHHQGGPTGYGCREFVVTPSTEGIIKEGQAYAWNPTIQGTKCEETTYLKDGKIDILTRTEQWPCSVISTKYGDFQVADILFDKK